MTRARQYRKAGDAVQGGNGPSQLFRLAHMEDNTTPEPDIGPLPPPPTLSDRLRRMRAVVNTLRDSFELAACDHSRHLGERVEVCDLVADELEAVAGELEKG